MSLDDVKTLPCVLIFVYLEIKEESGSYSASALGFGKTNSRSPVVNEPIEPINTPAVGTVGLIEDINGDVIGKQSSFLHRQSLIKECQHYMK